MAVLGKILGGMIGVIGGPFGVFVGIVVGHYLIDRRKKSVSNKGDQITPYGIAVFQCLGKLAKCDGPIAKEEIVVVEGFIREWNLSKKVRTAAIAAFRAAKDDYQPAREFLLRVGELKKWDHEACSSLLLAMYELSRADGSVNTEERQFMYEAAACFRLGATAVDDLVGSEAKAEEDWFELLAANENMSDYQLKAQYRKKCLELHPDKLSSKDLPPELMAFATHRVAKVREAYERILASRR